jgi:hypothetical protein
MVVYESLELDSFTAVTGVRIPLGTPKLADLKCCLIAFVMQSASTLRKRHVTQLKAHLINQPMLERVSNQLGVAVHTQFI